MAVKLGGALTVDAVLMVLLMVFVEITRDLIQ